MANMTLRLNDEEEKMLEELMHFMGENTKSKTIIEVIKEYKRTSIYLGKVIEQKEKTERDLWNLKEAVNQHFTLSKHIEKLVSD